MRASLSAERLYILLNAIRVDVPISVLRLVTRPRPRRLAVVPMNRLNSTCRALARRAGRGARRLRFLDVRPDARRGEITEALTEDRVVAADGGLSE